jgi:hypothetical protein
MDLPRGLCSFLAHVVFGNFEPSRQRVVILIEVSTDKTKDDLAFT